MYTKYLESSLKEEDAAYVEDVPAGEGWLHLIKKGQTFRILDLEGNQAVDTLFISAKDPSERYSVQQTVQRQANCLVGVGTRLYSNDDNLMLTVVADTCGEHDTLGSGCSAEGNVVRYTDKTRYMHSCRDTFVRTLENFDMAKRDQVCNLNFFTKVILDDKGRLEFADGISGPGKYIELRAEMDVLFLLSDCAQLNNPCNDYNPTPIRMVVFDG